MKIVKIVFISILIILSTLFIIIQLFVVPYHVKKRTYYENLKKDAPIKYCYFVDTSDFTVRDGLYTENINQIDSLIRYYNRISPNYEPYINFDCEIIDKDSIVHVIEYLKENRNITKIIFNNGDVINQVGFVYTKTLHEKKFNYSVRSE